MCVCVGGVGTQGLELEHTDVEALTDVSGTDAHFAQACAAACGPAHVCRFLTRVCMCTSTAAGMKRRQSHSLLFASSVTDNKPTLRREEAVLQRHSRTTKLQLESKC